VTRLSGNERRRLESILAEIQRRRYPWSLHSPEWPKRNEQQVKFLALTCKEAMYGGAARGGKTDALLMAALKYVDTPGYSALLLRRTFADLTKPYALIPRSHEWLSGKAHWDGQLHQWQFPSGATLTFGYCDNDKDVYQYQGSDYHFIGFDELTQFTEWQYTWMFSRLNRLEGSDLPLYVRSASNPGGVGHDWVKARFVLPHRSDDRVFVPARLPDNPYVDQESYLESLAELDPVTRAQYLEGNWDVLPQGDCFKREWFGTTLPDRPAFLTHWVRYWDKAATEGGGDWSAGVLMGRGAGLFFILDVVRGQWSWAARNTVMQQKAAEDARSCPRYSIWLEQEPGSGGKESALRSIAELAGYDVHAETVTGSKRVRANPFAAQCEVGNVKLIEGAWNAAYLSELAAFTGDDKRDVHDDQVDASSGAFAKLAVAVHKSGMEKYA